jgi:hypothetical protein
MMVFQTPAGVGERASLELVVPRLWKRDPDDRGRERSDASPAFSPNVGDAGGSSFPGREVLEGPWRFSFELENHGGTGWRGKEVAREAGVTLTLHRVVVSPTLVRAWISWSGDPLVASKDDVWTANAVLEHVGHRFGPGGTSTAGTLGDVTIRRGSDDPAGRWTVRVDRLTSDPGNPPRQIEIEGPWVFHIDMPKDGDASL